MAENKENIVKTIVAIVKANVQVDEKTSFDYDTNLIDSRFMTSLSFVKMLKSLEKELGIIHRLDQITLEDFSTMNKIISTELRILDTGV